MGIPVVFVINLGGLTPPVGVIMLTVCGILGVGAGAYARASIPFFIAPAPGISTMLPKLLMRPGGRAIQRAMTGGCEDMHKDMGQGPLPDAVLRGGRARIVSLAMPPGTRLSRPELAEAFDVSQTPVRDATLKLEQEGLVDIHPQSKTVVSRIDVEHARKTQFLRLALELEIGRTLALQADIMARHPDHF
jgi:DNA-binding transcriptional regulator YhcF (GntR family)